MKKIEEIMSKEMSRQDFLKLVGASFLGVIGVGAFVQNVHKLLGISNKSSSSSGYGRSPYGR